MANEQNLRPPRTKKEARERGKQGGIKSGEARRKKKAMKEQMELLLSLPLKDEKIKEQFEEMGIDTDNIDNQMAMMVAMWNKAIHGNTSAFNSIREVTGERVQEIKVNQVNDAKVLELQKMLEEE